MIRITDTTLLKNIFGILNDIVRFHEVVSVSTKAGNVVILPEDTYDDLISAAGLNELNPPAE